MGEASYPASAGRQRAELPGNIVSFYVVSLSLALATTGRTGTIWSK